MAVAAIAPERWKQLRPLLDRALDLDDAARAAFLQEVSADSEDLRADLERLIARHQATTGLAEPAAQMASPAVPLTVEPRADPWIGRRIGRYQLVRQLGAGGMGTVYEGQRIEGGFRQTVAIKLVAGIHPGLNARFERERQIMAELRHPHIAQLLDGGETADGMPYFALEYVDGRPLGEHCEMIGADAETRVRLLVEVAEALAYAHRRNVIHRDIKPSNILVSADGHVKLLDFGIAKLLKGESGPTLTQQRMGPMTPEYAAPEQFRGGELSAATDIYQFGVLLYRLLTGRLPYKANSDDGLAWARAVSEQEPITLTAALREARRNAAGPMSGEITLRRQTLRRGRELDAIVRRCLAKDPAARYAGMDALIADLSAWLAPDGARRGQWRRAALWAALAVAVGAALPSLMPLLLDSLPSKKVDATTAQWQEDPALHAYGLRPENLHVEKPATEDLILRAILLEARGDAPAALTLLATAHRSDARTPVPALFSAYWSSSLADAAEIAHWRAEAKARLVGLNDPYLDLLAQFVVEDLDGSVESSLRLSAAILEMRPEAWFMRLARAHALSRRDLREAALSELQQVDVPRLSHRKLVDALADRASFGDIPGAWAAYRRLEQIPGDPNLAVLRARLSYAVGDLVAARDAYLEATRLGRAAVRFDVEARGLLLGGVLSGALGDYTQADGLLQQARLRLVERKRYHDAADVALVLAQLAALSGETERVRRELASAREFLAHFDSPLAGIQIDLSAARLLQEPLKAPESIEGIDDPALLPLIEARQASQQGDRGRAKSSLERARAAGISEGRLVEEAALLARELDAPPFELKSIDPPFGPYSRYASRWALGQGLSIAPPRVEIPPE